jgi:thymidine phosphorylase
LIFKVKAGNRSGVKTEALLTDMNSPLGYMIGNALEVAESIDCLHGKGPKDLTELVKQLGMLRYSFKCVDL